MEYSIVEFKQVKEKQNMLLEYLKNCDWDAGKLLAELLIKDEFFNKEDKILFLLDNNFIVSFLTLAHQDCIADKTLSPWIGFVYTDKKYRGHRNSEILIKYALNIAKLNGNKNVYLATDHIGLYEKYGFTYWKNMEDIYKEDSRIYTYNL